MLKRLRDIGDCKYGTGARREIEQSKQKVFVKNKNTGFKLQIVSFKTKILERIEILTEKRKKDGN